MSSTTRDELRRAQERRRSVRSSAHELLEMVDQMSLRSPEMENLPRVERPKRASKIGKAWNFLSDDSDPELGSSLGRIFNSSNKEIAARKKKNRPTVVIVDEDYYVGSKPSVALGHGRAMTTRGEDDKSSKGLFGWKRNNDADLANINIATRKDSKDSIELAETLAQINNSDDDNSDEPLWNFRDETAGDDFSPPWNLKRSLMVVAILAVAVGTILSLVIASDQRSSGQVEVPDVDTTPLSENKGTGMESNAGETETETFYVNDVDTTPVENTVTESESNDGDRGPPIGATQHVEVPAAAETTQAENKATTSTSNAGDIGASPLLSSISGDFPAVQSVSVGSNQNMAGSPQKTLSESSNWSVPHPQPADHKPFGPSDNPLQASVKKEGVSSKETRTTKNRCGVNWLDATRNCPATFCNHSSECLGAGESCWQAITCVEGDVSSKPDREP